MGVGDLLASARLIGAANSARAVHSAARRMWHDRALDSTTEHRGVGPCDAAGRRAHRRGRNHGRVRTPGALRQVTPTTTGAEFTFDASTLRICLLAGGSAFISWDAAGPTPSYALTDDANSVMGPTMCPAMDTPRVHQADSDWIVACDELSVRVDPNGGLAFHTPAHDTPAHDIPAHDDTRPFRRDAPPWWIGSAWTHRSATEPGAGVFGLGGRGGALDRVGGRYRLWNSEPGGSFGPGTDPLSVTMPVYLVVHDRASHLVFYDNSHDGSVDVRPGAVSARLTDGALRYYVFPGSPAEALDRYTALTGRPALPPRWALGYHQSRWDYPDQATLHDVVDGFERHGLQLSGLWLDIEHLDGRRVFTVDHTRFPDLPALARQLATSDAHLVAIVDPGIKRERGFELYEQGRAADVFCTTAQGQLAEGVSWPGTIVYPDFTSPRARAWWQDQYHTLVDHGIDGCWHDMNEPSSFVAFGEPTLPLTTRHDLDGRGGDHREAHNLYGLCMARAGYEGMRRSRPDRRPFLISRSGWAGIQRYGGSWSGDVETSWAGLRASLAFTLGLGLCGVPYSGPDLGGFTAHPSDELYLRWFQLSAHLPFFRTHCTRDLPPREPWEFGPAVLADVRTQLRERYRLLPYWYTLAWQAHRTGAPYVRPLWWADPSDATLRGTDDAFLLGEALLVAPVLDDGVREREVSLPPGRWYDRRDGTAHEGPGIVRMDAPLGQIPVLARAGSVLPVNEEGELVLQAYHPAAAAPHGDGQMSGPAPVGGRLVTDAGDGADEPRDERFTVITDADGTPALAYEGPEPALPYRVRWLPTR